MTPERDDTAVIDAASGGSPPTDRGPTSRSPERSAFRLLGIVALAYSVALIVSPAVPRWRYSATSGHGGCGVPLQALFGPPGDGCTQVAYTRAAESAAIAVVGVGLLAFSGIRRRLRFLGLVTLGLSLFPMMFSTSEWQPVEANGIGYQCGAAIGDLARRGDTELTANGGWQSLSPLCGDRALSRLYLTLGMAGVGILILVVDAIRRRNAQPAVG